MGLAITDHHYLALSIILFFIGVFGVFFRRNIIIIFMCIELMFNAANLAFVTFSKNLPHLTGDVIVFFVMAIAAAEAAIGLALVVLIYRQRKSSDIDELNLLKG